MKTRKGLTKEMVEMKASGLSYGDIAGRSGCTRQNIQQLFKPKIAEMIIISDRSEAKCEECGQFEQFGHYHHKSYDFNILNEPDNIIYLCVSCHLKLNGEAHYCKHCGAVISYKKRYCSNECKRAYYSVPHECSHCHTQFTMNATQKIRIRKSKSGLIFCSKQCQGKYLAEHFGFTAHPENIRNHKKRLSKYFPMIPEIIMRLKTKESLYSVLKSKGISPGNYTMIKKLIREYQSLLSLV